MTLGGHREDYGPWAVAAPQAGPRPRPQQLSPASSSALEVQEALPFLFLFLSSAAHRGALSRCTAGAGICP